jgi:hypothetical protein
MMEWAMTNLSASSSDHTDREIYGANVLMGVLIFLAAVLAVAFLAGTSPEMGAHAQAHAQTVAAVVSQQAAS